MIAPHFLRRRNKSRGSAIVEMGLVMITFLALVLATVDFGMAIFVKATLQHAVREGVRYAITYQMAAGLKHDDSIKAVVMQQSMGILQGTTGASQIYIRYFDPANPGTELSGVGSNAPQSIVQVSVEGYQWKWFAPIWRSATPLSIYVMSADRMETLPGGLTAPPART